MHWQSHKGRKEVLSSGSVLLCLHNNREPSKRGEYLGGWQCAEREVKKLGAALARHTGQEEAEAITHLWGRLGILLQRGNAAILGNRVPALPEAHIDGVL